VCFVVWNGLLIVRYALGDVPRMGPVPLKDLIVGQFTVIPTRLKELLHMLINRGP
jgi:hypothetical protein